MRSLLIVDARDDATIAAALASGAGAVALALDGAAATRARAAALLAAPHEDGPALFVRVSALDSGETDRDLDAIMGARPAAIVLPRCAAGADVQRLAAKLAVREAEHGWPDGETAILAAIETAEAVLALASFRNASPRLAALAWDAESLRADLGAEAAHDASGALCGALRLARDATLTAAAAARVAAIDTGALLDPQAFAESCRAARRDGFRAKIVRDGEQAEIANAAFGR